MGVIFAKIVSQLLYIIRPVFMTTYQDAIAVIVIGIRTDGIVEGGGNHYHISGNNEIK